MAATRVSRDRRAGWRTGVLVALAGVVAVVVLGYAVVWQLVEPAEPGDFYATPAQLPSEPGLLLRTEPVDTGIARANAYRILYSSRDLAGRPAAVSGLVLVPHAAPPADGFPVVGWAHGTSGVARRCAPSLAPQDTHRTIAAGQQLIDAGYLIAATDYPGLGTEGPHPYLVSDSEARAVLDSVRAVHSNPDWRAGPRFVLWGHSQGGHAALSASQRAPSYAPELDLAGTAVAAPATDLSTLLHHDLTEPVGKVFGSMALVSWSRLFPDAELSAIVKPADLPLVSAVAAGCIETTSQGLVLLPETSMIGDEFLVHDPTVTPPWATIISDNSVPAAGIDQPLLLVQGTADTVIPPEVSADWAGRMCRHNPAVTFREYRGADHLSVVEVAADEVVGWLGERLSGARPASQSTVDCPSATP